MEKKQKRQAERTFCSYFAKQYLLFIELVLVSRSFQIVYRHQGRDDGRGGKAQHCEESFKSRVKIFI